MKLVGEKTHFTPDHIKAAVWAPFLLAGGGLVRNIVLTRSQMSAAEVVYRHVSSIMLLVHRIGISTWYSIGTCVGF